MPIVLFDDDPSAGGATSANGVALAAQPTTPIVPCFAVPFRVGPDGNIATVEQDSVDDVAACVAILLGTERGSRLEAPDYGISDPLFRSSLNDAEIQGQLAVYEPRAVAVLNVGPGADDLARQVTVLVEAAK